MNLPDYDALPRNEVLGMRYAWGLFGEGDQIGTLNYLGAEQRVAAASLIRRGVLFNLSLPLDLPSPPLFRRKPFRHVILQEGRNTQEDYLDQFYLQASSQWDGLRHIAAREFGYYGGTPHDAVAGSDGPLGIEHMVGHGLVGRAVLLDVAGYLERQAEPVDPLGSFAIRPEHLEATRAAQRVEIRPGDILLVRTGWMAGYLAADSEGRERFARTFAFPGLYAGEETARYLWNLRVAAVAADNPALEVAPGDRAAGSLHRRLIPMLGMPIGELFDLEALAADCREDGRYEVFFAAVPLYLRGGVASPANAVALK